MGTVSSNAAADAMSNTVHQAQWKDALMMTVLVGAVSLVIKLVTSAIFPSILGMIYTSTLIAVLVSAGAIFIFIFGWVFALLLAGSENIANYAGPAAWFTWCVSMGLPMFGAEHIAFTIIAGLFFWLYSAAYLAHLYNSAEA